MKEVVSRQKDASSNISSPTIHVNINEDASGMRETLYKMNMMMMMKGPP